VGKRIQFRGVCRRDLPILFARACIDGDKVSIECRKEDLVAQNRQAARQSAAAVSRRRNRRVVETPDHLSGRGIQRDDVVRTLNRVHRAVHDKGRHFMLLE
jgi:hypothetical protein